MADQTQGLSAQDLNELRTDVEKQLDLATAAIAAPAPAGRVCRLEYNRGLETAYRRVLDHLDELLADAVTFSLVDPIEGQA